MILDWTAPTLWATVSQALQRVLSMVFSSRAGGEDIDDPLRGTAVPEGRTAVRPGGVGQSAKGLFEDAAGVAADDAVGPMGDGDRTLRRVSEGEAGDPEDRRLLLDAAGVRQNQLGATHESDEVEIAEGVEGGDALAVNGAVEGGVRRADVALPEELLPDARVQGEHDGQVAG